MDEEERRCGAEPFRDVPGTEVRIRVRGWELLNPATNRDSMLESFRTTVEAILTETALLLSRRGVEISVSFVEVEKIRELKARYLGEDHPTDVLSFPLFADEDGFRPPDWAELPLGDIVVCPDVARENALAERRSPEAELALLLVHGLLHLLGFDHSSEEERDRMWALQDRFVPPLASAIRTEED
jgi:probable rRNA maturation factor